MLGLPPYYPAPPVGDAATVSGYFKELDLWCGLPLGLVFTLVIYGYYCTVSLLSLEVETPLMPELLSLLVFGLFLELLLLLVMLGFDSFALC